MYWLKAGMPVLALWGEVMNGMSEQLGPWLGVTEIPHSSLNVVDKPDSAEQLLSADFTSGDSNWKLAHGLFCQHRRLRPLADLNRV